MKIFENAQLIFFYCCLFFNLELFFDFLKGFFVDVVLLLDVTVGVVV
jgi:hypothetical protein